MPDCPPGVPAGGSLSALLALVVADLTALESQMAAEAWLPKAWVAAHGPRADTLRTGMLYMNRGWRSVESLVRSRRGADLGEVRAAAIEMAAAALKLAADLDYLVARNLVAAGPPPAAPGKDADDDLGDLSELLGAAA